jgi:putative hydrolase of the HAD superfamily
MTRAVLLDFYGTLAHATTWGPTRREVMAERGFEIPDDAAFEWSGTSDNIDGAEHLEHSRSAETYEAWDRDRLRSFVTACGVGPDDAGPLVDDLYAATKSYELEAYPEVPDVLRDLRSRGLTVAVCSNWDWHLDKAMAQAGLTDLVDVQVTSARAGARKPHPRIFLHTLEACGGIDPADAVFIGDSWGPDVEGPAAAGMRPVHVWRPEWDADRDPPPPLTDGVVRVRDLRGLLDLV